MFIHLYIYIYIEREREIVNITRIYEGNITIIYGDTIGLVWFYGISTIVGYLIPNPVYKFILNIVTY